MSLIWLYASLAMCAQDILGVLLTDAQARDRGNLAGLLDMAGWLVAIYTTNWALEGINSHDAALKVLVLVAVTAANFVGSKLGVYVGKRFVRTSTPSVEQRLLTLETQVLAGGHQ